MFLAVLSLAASAPAGIPADQAQKLYDRVGPSLVAVKYTLESELGRRELIGPGVIVSEDGMVMCPLTMFDARIPDDQMKDFKVLIAHEDRDPQELEAVFQGRDERVSMAFLKTREPQKWAPLKFEEQPVGIGEPIVSVGVLPEAANYKPYLMQGTVSAQLRGPAPQVLVDGGLAAMGSPVFNADGKAIGIVEYQQGQPVLLNEAAALGAITNPPKIFIPARDFLLGLQDPPHPGKPQELPWMGVTGMSGLNKDVSEVYGLTDQPAVQIGEVIPDTPAARAGLKKGQIIVKVDGKPLERGDEPVEVWQILQRKILRMKPGDTVTFSVMAGKQKPITDVQVKLEPQPKRPNLARRFFAEDLGFSVREVVFYDTYAHKLPPDSKGVVVSLIRPQSSSESGGLHPNDFVTDLNGQPVKDLEEFKTSYTQFREEKPREAVVLVVLRESNTQTIRIEPPQDFTRRPESKPTTDRLR